MGDDSIGFLAVGFRTAETNPIVDPRRLALPELDYLRHHQITTPVIIDNHLNREEQPNQDELRGYKPVGRPWDGCRFIGVLLLQLFLFVNQYLAG